jgi:2-polyprenyl-3-methyl-5-hydroxy-6-metoxy-1,4-benzoquinol methylase
VDRGQETGVNAPGRAQAESAVKACYSTWAKSYHDDYYGGATAYPPVHQDIVRRVLRESGARTVIDAGCGPASMLRSLTDLGADLYGFDLTPEMVTEARTVMQAHGVPAGHIWEGSVAEPAAFRNASAPALYDAAICVGVLPHVTETDEAAAMANLHGALRPGGTVVVEARNQLFALFTLNRYSCELFLNELIKADQLTATGADRASIDTALEDMKRQFRMDLPPLRGGKSGEPGYDEVLSRTHNPLVLQQQMRHAGFEKVRLLFYHYHCLPPMFEQAMPRLFRELSLAMEDPEDWRGHFMASAFIVTGRKA